MKALTILHHRLQNLAGTARSFRLEPLSKNTETVEQATMDLLLSGRPVREKELTELQAMLETVLSDGGRISRQETDPSTEVVPQSFNPSLLFLVDDDTRHREHLTEQLRLFGYQVQPFCNLREMQQGLKNARPDAMIVDLSPAASDLECIGEIQRIQQDLSLPCPLIFVSNEDDLGIRFAAVQANAEAFFRTPIRVERLVERLDTLTARSSERPLRALVVDDDEVVGRLHADFLVSTGMQVQVLQDPSRLLPALAEFAPELVLMDVFMPDYNGIDLVRMMRQHETYQQIPVVYLSSEKDEKRQIDAIRSGGDDFLSKPVQPSHLISSVMHLARRYRQEMESVHRDPLTGLFNHTRIRDQLRLIMERRAATGAPLSLALLRVERMGEINHRHGDPAGDGVLRGLAHLLHQYHSPSTPVGRLGGCTFALLLPGLSGDQAAQHMALLLEKLHGIRHQSDKEEFAVDLSVGLASSPPAKDFADLTAAATAALDAAREQGGNCLIRAEQVRED